MRTQQRWLISPAMLKTVQQNPQSLEKNFSGERTFTVNLVQKMLKQCAGIGCVTDSQGRRLGTGFLVAASDLGFANTGEWVFITNDHVIGKNTADAIDPENAWVTFELECVAKGKPISHKVSPKVLFASPPGSIGKPDSGRLDFSVLVLETWPEGAVALRVNTNLPALSHKTKVFIVGHPSGDALQLSLHDSQLLDVCDDKILLHYRTPTEPGSSGSPVFNGNWEVVALHHAGSHETPRLRGTGTYEANEGISIRSIRETITSPSTRK
jgi:V8-like Glu-specific endopeptidase